MKIRLNPFNIDMDYSKLIPLALIMGEKEKHIEHYPNGKKKKEGTFKDGKADGLFTNWYESGQTSFKGTYIDGKKDGLFTWWYVNGKKEYEGTYKNGRKISVKEWNEDGSVK